MSDQTKSFFSVASEFIHPTNALPFDLYINSSVVKNHERFIRIHPQGEALSEEDLHRYKEKYHQIYLPESQRSLYLKSLTHSKTISDAQKTTVLKDTAIEYLGRIFDQKHEFSTEVLTETIKGCRDAVESMVDVIHDYSIEKLQKMIASLSFHDFYTYDHSINVSMYCILIFEGIQPNAKKEDVILAGLGGMLHDLGKIRIPTKILNNSGKLSDEDFETIKKHPEWGLAMLKSLQSEIENVDLETLGRIVYEHHENFNGTGYPKKIKQEKIHLLARVTAIADFFDAITTKRSYHEALNTEDALSLMSNSKGKKLDPKLFDLFTQKIKTFALEGKLKKQVPDSFDPCQPHDQIPLEDFKEDEKSFGKIQIRENPKKAKVS